MLVVSSVSVSLSLFWPPTFAPTGCLQGCCPSSSVAGHRSVAAARASTPKVPLPLQSCTSPSLTPGPPRAQQHQSQSCRGADEGSEFRVEITHLEKIDRSAKTIDPAHIIIPTHCSSLVFPYSIALLSLPTSPLSKLASCLHNPLNS